MASKRFHMFKFLASELTIEDRYMVKNSFGVVQHKYFDTELTEISEELGFDVKFSIYWLSAQIGMSYTDILAFFRRYEWLPKPHKKGKYRMLFPWEAYLIIDAITHSKKEAELFGFSQRKSTQLMEEFINTNLERYREHEFIS